MISESDVARFSFSVSSRYTAEEDAAFSIKSSLDSSKNPVMIEVITTRIIKTLKRRIDINATTYLANKLLNIPYLTKERYKED